MKPTTAAGAGGRGARGTRGARAHRCHWSRDRPHAPPPTPPGPESPTPWRPWILSSQDAELSRTGRQLEPGGDQQTWGSPGAFGFQHPVRLYLPLSKRQEYLQSSGEKVLASFPVQATIHFYNDESEEEEEEKKQEEDTMRAKFQCQGAPGLEGDSPLLHRVPEGSSSG